MNEYEVVPFTGIGPVRLGMSRAEVWAAMSADRTSFLKGPFSTHETDAWYENAFQVFYGGETVTAEFVEIASHVGIRVTFRGLSIFDTPVDEVVAHVSGFAPLDATHPELGYTYTFPELELSLWRPVISDDADGRFFQSIGIGVKGYYTQKT